MSYSVRSDKKIFFPELSFKITGILFYVHNSLGRYSREKQYADLIEEELNKEGIHYVREYELESTGNRVDFLIEDSIILELKAKILITKEDYHQVQRYLQSSGKDLGLLVNFRNRYLKPLRVLRIQSHISSKRY